MKHLKWTITRTHYIENNNRDTIFTKKETQFNYTKWGGYGEEPVGVKTALLVYFVVKPDQGPRSLFSNPTYPVVTIR